MAIAAFVVSSLMLIVNFLFIPVAMSTPPPPDPMHGFLIFVAFCLLTGGLCVNLTAFILALISVIKTSKRRSFSIAALFISTPQIIVELWFTLGLFALIF